MLRDAGAVRYVLRDRCECRRRSVPSGEQRIVDLPRESLNPDRRTLQVRGYRLF